MRTLPLLDDEYDQDADNYTRWKIAKHLMYYLPLLGNEGTSTPDQSSMTEIWMYDPPNVFLTGIGLGTDPATTRSSWADLPQLGSILLGERLTAVWNTFYQSTYAASALTGSIPKNLTELAHLLQPILFNEMQSATAENQDIAVVHWPWLVAFVFSAVILQIAAIAGVVLKYLSLAPNVVGYASSLTLMNPYISVPTGATTLNGLERAVLLSRVRVEIGDVCPDEPVGAIALTEADDERVGRLDRNRLYA